jgi:protease-4
MSRIPASEQATTAEAAGRDRSLPPRVEVILRRSKFSVFAGWAGWILAAGLAIGLFTLWSATKDYFDTSKGLTESFHSGDENADEKIAIIHVDGVIVEGDGYVKKQIDRIRDDEDVKAVVLRIDSPGGTVTGSDYIFHHLRRLRDERDLPIVVSMGGMATSGGYYVAMAVGSTERTIFAEPTTTTGSIGVIMPHYDVSGLLAEYKVKDDSVSTHPRKQMLSMTRPMNDEERKLVESYIGDSFERFKAIVREGRPGYQSDPPKLDALATGEIFAASKAKELGLVDEIGFIEEAIERAAELAKLPANLKDVRVVEYNRPFSVASELGLVQSRSADPLSAMLEASAPRAYYLSSTLPHLAATRRAD